MEKSLRKASRFGEFAKFWNFIFRVCGKAAAFAEQKAMKNQGKQKIIMDELKLTPKSKTTIKLVRKK